MGKLSASKKGVKRTVKVGRVVPEAMAQMEDLDARVEAIQLLIPLGLKAVTEELQRAVLELAGPRYQRKGSDQPLRRWGSQPGSVYLSDQKVPVVVPRVRNVDHDTEVPLRAYQALQTPRKMDEGFADEDVEGYRHTELRGLCRDRSGELRSVLLVGVPSVCESHGTEAGRIPRALPGRA